jgi:hypothetical protein
MSDPMDISPVMEAHNRALVALLSASNMNEEQADEVITSLVSLVFETLKQYLPGEDTCN